MSVVILACSPRAGGNSDAMAQLVAQGVRQEGKEAQVVYLRDYSILPCTSCGACFQHATQRCVLEDKDDTERLFQLLEGEGAVVLTLPIYFYHVPAVLKALLDRGQKYWAKRQAAEQDGTAVQKHEKHLYPVLVAARPRGENLFTGTLLSLRLFGELFQRTVGDGSVWRGYDGPQDFLADAQACAAMVALGCEVAQEKNGEVLL